MRHFVYGLIFGAAAMYFYTFHWGEVVFLKGYFDSGRDWAVEETRKYK